MIRIDEAMVFIAALLFYFGAAIAYFCFKKELLSLNNTRIDSLMKKIPAVLLLLSLFFCFIWGLNTAIFIALTTALHCVTLYLVIKWLRYVKKAEEKLEDYDWGNLASKISGRLTAYRKKTIKKEP